MARDAEVKFGWGNLFLALVAILGLMWVYGENLRDDREDLEREQKKQKAMDHLADIMAERRAESARAAAIQFMHSIGSSRDNIISVRMVSGDGLFYQFEMNYVRAGYLLEAKRQCDRMAFEALMHPGCWIFQIAERQD